MAKAAPSDEQALQAAVDAWRDALGDEAVHTDAASLQRSGANVSGLTRRIPAVLRPADTDAVREAVRIANRFRVPLHPVSTGRNWGMGSRLPPSDGTCILDLGEMRRIREVSVAGHYAVVEPGVTQWQLYQYLRERDLPLVLNVIGSSRYTSLIGNALDRGVGYFSTRASSLSALEVVLGDGRLLRTGFSHYPGAANANVYRHGVGPDLEGLFFQSNFGVVTAACMDLIPRAECSLAVLISLQRDEQLPALVERLALLRRRQILRTVVHIANRERGEITLAPLVADCLAETGNGDARTHRQQALDIVRSGRFGPWSAVAGLMLNRCEVRQVKREIRRGLRGVASVRFLTDTRLALAKRLTAALSAIPYFDHRHALVRAIEPLYGLTRGIPTDAALKSVYWPLADSPADWREPDLSHSGVLYVLPFIPLSGDAAAETVALTREVFDTHGFTPYITLNVADSKSMESVINLAFDRRQPEHTRAAHLCVEELQQRFIERGFIPYRLGIQSMSQVVDEHDSFWQTVRDVKAALDPNGIISPGRYSLP